MKKIFVLLFLISFARQAFCETVNLKDGRSVMGKISEKSNKSVTVEVDGIPMTYYADEIKDIDGSPMIVKEMQEPAKLPIEVTGAGKVQVANNSVLKVSQSGSKRDLILKFIDVFGTRKVMAQNFDAMLTSIAQQKPEEAQKIRDRIKVDEIIERLITLYDKHFTEDELRAYIEFYSSKVGQKLIYNISEIMKESIQVSTDYMKEKFPDLDKEQ